jgi:antirestriction protein ArdC
MRDPIRRDIYQEVTDRILEILAKGTVPWRNPIAKSGGDGWPKNLDSGKKYRGVNVFLLAAMGWVQGYKSDYWVTYKQALAHGGQVRKGEKSSLVVFWKSIKREDQEKEESCTVPVLKHYNVFNVEQCEGISAPQISRPEILKPFAPITAAAKIVADFPDPPTIKHGGNGAVYSPTFDMITIAEPCCFEDAESYYATLFHECVHATGHSKRLNRGLDTNLAPFGSLDYSKEELVAEMGAAFLAAVAGISLQSIDQSASYIQGWSQRLRSDRKLVVLAAGAAQKACDHILGASLDANSTSEEGDHVTLTEPEPSA